MKRDFPWAFYCLAAAGIYNLAWGAWVVLFPTALFDMLKAARPNYLELWQCIGMIVGVYGIGYLIAATNPSRHWPIVLVGFLGKVFGPIGFIGALSRGSFPAGFAWVIVFNDLVWLLPFALILRQAAPGRAAAPRSFSFEEALHFTGSHGSLLRLSQEAPTLVIFLRHSGCCFFGSLLSKVFSHKTLFHTGQWNLVIFHMGRQIYPPEKGIFWVSDPEQKFYAAFGLTRGTLWQVLGPRVWWKGLQAVLKGNWVGPLGGDGLQMPGMFVLRNGKLTQSFRPKTLAEEFPVADYLKGSLLPLLAFFCFFHLSGFAAQSIPSRKVCALAIASTFLATFPHSTDSPLVEVRPAAPFTAYEPEGLEGPWVVKSKGKSPIVIEVFQKGWLSQAVALRMKERLVKRCPEANTIAGWSAAGLKVPIHTMEFVENTSGVHLRVSGTYFEMTSKEAIDLNALDGKETPPTLSFSQRIEDPDGQGAQISVELKIRPGVEKDTWEVSEVKGSIGAFGPFFFHSEEFNGGPWTAVHAPSGSETPSNH